MIQSFRSVAWLGAITSAALGCYMVSLRVASERAALERTETAILVARRDIRALDTELTTRGRVRQLERWNEEVLALSAPTQGQFLSGRAQLAILTAPASPGMSDAPEMLATAPPVEEAPDARVVLASYAADSRPRAAAVVTKVQRSARASFDMPASAARPAIVRFASMDDLSGKIAGPPAR